MGDGGAFKLTGGTMTEPVLSEVETVEESRAVTGLC